MRKLGLRDAFALARIIKAAGIRKEIIDFAAEISGRDEEQSTEKVGFEFFLTVIDSVADEAIERKIYELYADVKGVTPEEIGVTDFATVKADISEIVRQNDLKNFFHSVSALMSKQ